MGLREDEVEGPFMKDKRPGCSSSVESAKESKKIQGHKKLLGTVFGAETVSYIGSQASPCGSTPHVVQHRAAAAPSLKPREFWNFAEGGFFRLQLGSWEPACGSTPRSSCILFFEDCELWIHAEGGFRH